MRKNNFLKTLSAFLVLIALSTLTFSCKSEITKEQLAEMQKLRTEERQIESKIEKIRNDIRTIQNEIDARNSELEDCNKNLDFVKEKAMMWPDVWDDYKPEKPAEESEEENK